MSIEGQRQPDRRRSGIVEAAAFATSLLGAVDQGPAHALEVSQKTSWNAAITENVRNAVMKEKNERLIVYTKFKDGSFAWPSVINGDSPNKMVVSNTEELKFMLKNFSGKSIEKRCQLHTHPHDLVTTPLGKSFSIPYSPPSNVDVGIANARASIASQLGYLSFNMPIRHDLYAVADASGVWYYRQSSAERINDEADKEWRKAFIKFQSKSALDPNFNFQTEYTALRQAYQVHYRADIRFVPYEQISKEPPCAGVDYKPGTLTPSYDVKMNQPPSTAQKKRPEVAVRPPVKIQTRDVPTRRSLSDIDNPRTRPHLDVQEPPTFHLGPPER